MDGNHFCVILGGRYWISVFNLQAGAEISTVNPEQYSKRFYDFIATILS